MLSVPSASLPPDASADPKSAPALQAEPLLATTPVPAAPLAQSPLLQPTVLRATLPSEVTAQVRTTARVPVEVAGAPVTLISTADLDATVTTRPDPAQSALQLRVATTSTEPAEVDVALDYGGFADLAGAGYGSRLRLMLLPDCASTYSGQEGCQPQPIPSRNDPSTTRLTGTLRFDGVRQSVNLVAIAGASGDKGDFSASSVGPSGTWSVAGSSGAFSWSYPIPTPPTAIGAGPSVSLSYSSSVLDGRVATTNNQTSWVGAGWDYSPGFIERTYQSCADVLGDRTVTNPGTPGLCWAGDLVSIRLGGSTVPLVLDKDGKGWHPESDPGWRVALKTANPSGTDAGEYWEVTTTDGTRYYYGREARDGGSTATDSRWTVPVRSARSNEPCYSAAGSWQSTCVRPWRWNLDYVVDVRGNITRYTYAAETNKYYADAAHPAVDYIRGGTLTRIDYGLQAGNDGTMPAMPGAQQVLFSTAERCFVTTTTDCDFTAANKANWKDTPVDLQCASSTCTEKTPSFWTTKRLSTITTQATDSGGSLKDVDVFTLTHQFPDNADRHLTLTTIQRTGRTGEAGLATIQLPPSSFEYAAMDNRVDTTQYTMLFPRLSSITTETGSQISVARHSDCAASSYPTPESNSTTCLPVRWTPPGGAAPITDWFHKYVTDSVTVTDLSGLSPAQVTAYTYVGGAAWAPDTDAMPAKLRTYGQFRGFAQVNTQTGVAPQAITYTETFYLRGVGATITRLDNTTYADDVPLLSDTAYRTRVFTAPGGSLVSASETEWKLLPAGSPQPTATRIRATPGPGEPPLAPQQAFRLAATATKTLTSLSGNRPPRAATTATTYDPMGRPILLTSTADATPAVCAGTSYAEDAQGRWILDRPAQTWTADGVCPASNALPASYTTRSQILYDDQAQGLVGNCGEPTAIWTYSSPTTHSTVTSQYDRLGRMTKSVALASASSSRASTTAYTPAYPVCPAQTMCPPTPTAPAGTITVTAGVAPGPTLSTTKTFDTLRGQPVTSTDPAGLVTTGRYDALGRLVSVWRPGRPTSGPASVSYAYLIGRQGPTVGASAVTTTTFVDTGTRTGTVTTIMLTDALGRPVQTQADDGTGNRVISDTFYDSHGWSVATNDRWYAAGAPATTVASRPAPSSIDARTVTTYDGVGRVVKVAAFQGDLEKRSSTTVYDGDSVTVIPPEGAVASTTFTDARGRTTMLRQYTSRPTLSTYNSTAHQDTSYSYDTGNRLTGITAVAVAQWSFGYDYAGRKLTSVDPDTGSTNYTYNLAGDLTSSTDARGVTLTTAYDSLGRRSSLAQGATTLAMWSYDAQGRATGSTRIDGDKSYSRSVSYDTLSRPSKVTLTLPDTSLLPGTPTGPSVGSYSTSLTYTSTGLPLTLTMPALGDLPAETLTTTYDQLARPTALTGLAVLVSDTTYSPYGEPTRITLGVNNQQGWLSFSRDPHTRSLTGLNLTTPALGQIENLSYAYDAAGNTTRVTDTWGPPSANTSLTTCYRYDALNQLTNAWTANDSCVAAPEAAVVATSAGMTATFAGYSTSWTYTNAMLNSRVHYDKGADTTTTDAFTNGAPGHAHAISATSTSVNGAPASISGTYTYDAAGNSITRPTPTGVETYTYDQLGRTKSIVLPNTTGTITYVNDADGAPLIRQDPTSTTLFLGGQEIVLKNGTKTATRYYSHAGRAVALRAGNTNPTWLLSDPNGTVSTTVATRSTGPDANGINRRISDPYGRILKQAKAAWADSHAYLDLPQTPNSLIDMGARKYDPQTGRFLAPDPVLVPMEPFSLAAYAYGKVNPITYSDPEGLEPQLINGEWHDGFGCGGICGGGSSGSSSSGYRSSGGSSGSSSPGPSDSSHYDWSRTNCSADGMCLYGDQSFGGVDNFMKEIRSDPSGAAANLIAGYYRGISDTALDLFDSNTRCGLMRVCLGPLAKKGLDDLERNWGRDPDSANHAAGSFVSNVALLLVPGSGLGKTSIAAESGVDGISVSLRYKDGWTAAQRAAADAKVGALNDAASGGGLRVTSVERSGTSAASRYRAAGGDVPAGSDVDHVIDLQLGGADNVANMSPLDLSVNRSLGSQIGWQLRGVPTGTCVLSFSIC